MKAELVVVGGGPAGHSAVQAFRQSGGVGPVVMLSHDTAPPYNRPPLSKDYLRGESDVSALPLEEPEFYSDNGIELRLSETVDELDTADRVVRTQSGAEIGYGRCILALGSVPAELPVPGGESAHTLRWLEQAVRLRDDAQVATTAVVIGSGFIGCEAAASRSPWCRPRSYRSWVVSAWMPPN
jgi:3-phenylpropionate/trans-cinnamate dioxygenase ferredoxin reductase subunit